MGIQIDYHGLCDDVGEEEESQAQGYVRVRAESAAVAAGAVVKAWQNS